MCSTCKKPWYFVEAQMEDTVHALIRHRQQVGILKSEMAMEMGVSLFKLSVLLFCYVVVAMILGWYVSSMKAQK
jgi:hypothetical protein